jgi:hypothetical protein
VRSLLSLCAALALLAAGAAAGPDVALSSGRSAAPPPPAGTVTQPAATPLRVVSMWPQARGAIAGDVEFAVRFSTALAPGHAAALKLAPALAGRWRQTGPRTLRFIASSAYPPGITVRLTVPAGMRASDGAVLEHAVKRNYVVGQPVAARLAQLLADLRYLPVHFASSGDPRWRSVAGQLRALYQPPAGRFAFGQGWPAALHGLWASDNALVLRGALMAFESQHGLAMDGVAGPSVWSALLQAMHNRQANPAGYNYAIGSEATPETLTVYHNGVVVVHTLVNTGIPAAPTAKGSFPVYERLASQVMQGTNPDGAHYADYVQWVAYFNGSDAVHYIGRSSWGYPQSLGCIEVPYGAAERAWGYLTYGTIVTVTG